MIPLRLVLDTNVVVSAALQPNGLPRTVLLIAITKPARWYVSPPILAEYRDVVSRPELRIRKGLQSQLLQIIRRRTHSVHLKRELSITSDPDDNKFLECAEVSRADYLVTGNLRHFPRFWRNTKIIEPREFLALIAPHLPA